MAAPWSTAYRDVLQAYYRFFIPAGCRVLEAGCGRGDLLAAVRPSRAVGVDTNPGLVEQGKRRHSRIEFHVAEICQLRLEEKFDYIIASDLINDSPDVQQLLEHLGSFAHARTRLVLNFLNNLWRPVLSAAEAARFIGPRKAQNWLSDQDAANLLALAGWEVVKTERKILWPRPTLGLGAALNRWLAPLLSHMCLTVFQIARPRPQYRARDYFCSVIVPARNEAGNIESAVERIPAMGRGTEIIFVEGHSQDGTREEIQRVAARFPELRIVTLKQTGIGKGAAVRQGFAHARGELLFILDADLTVRPEDLPKFYEAACSGGADFVNGVRFVYPMEDQAMRFINMAGNKFFSLAFGWLLGCPVKDTLCGTKVLFRSDYDRIQRNRSHFGDFDPFGDFDLLFGAAKLNLRIVDLPIRYGARRYGSTNIRRWRHGWLLLRMLGIAALRLKFV